MPVYTVLLILASVRAALALVALARSRPGSRPWSAAAQGAAEICCALLLRLYLDPPFRQAAGWWIYPAFVFALIWSVGVWIVRLWALTGGETTLEPPSILGAVGVGVESGAVQVGRVLWHVCFVAPSLVCGGFVIFGLAAEMRPPH
jgi:hypothetical protein